MRFIIVLVITVPKSGVRIFDPFLGLIRYQVHFMLYSAMRAFLSVFVATSMRLLLIDAKRSILCPQVDPRRGPERKMLLNKRCRKEFFVVVVVQQLVSNAHDERA